MMDCARIRRRAARGSVGGYADSPDRKGAYDIMRKAYRKPRLRKVGQLKDVTRSMASD